MHSAEYTGEAEDLSGVLRFGKLRRAGARGVVYELRILLPEAEKLSTVLAPFGVKEDFMAEGRDILNGLGSERDETTQIKAEREKVMRQVREAERRLSSLLRRLVAADEAAALERPDAALRFTLDIINAERGRVGAERAPRLALRLADDPGPDATDPDPWAARKNAGPPPHNLCSPYCGYLASQPAYTDRCGAWSPTQILAVR